MAQGQQRGVDATGKVFPFKEPSPQLLVRPAVLPLCTVRCQASSVWLFRLVQILDYPVLQGRMSYTSACKAPSAQNHTADLKGLCDDLWHRTSCVPLYNIGDTLCGWARCMLWVFSD